MLTDEVIRLARQVLLIDGSGACSHEPNRSIIDTLERYTALVEAEVRKEIEAAVLAEREACADIVDHAHTPDCGGWTAEGIAQAIRARTPPVRINDAHKE